ncbi:hemerythrin domain-containing protein [Hydrogenophaga sp.]|uniref:hemerythrin domain-containing protein n=1 Tax=Hydrogenophaga sp. TaxID=1904254 RepID=UPI00272669B7|nr:hemerythrin domain-containing protein [Hydrogenophaga sp.]MDO8906177.1 hemerythrin domain-containing protein [Hydrogenophaga sp.]
MATSIPLTQISMPGHRAPGAGFEAPFEMLDACHERVERMLKLLARLQQRLLVHGWDESVAQAARDVMRYFDQAAPQHHEDEERHVFPPLLAQGDAVLVAMVQKLQADHREMERSWLAVREVLASLTEAPPAGWTGITPAQAEVLGHFTGLYRHHLDDEDGLIYPAAQARLSAEALRAMSADMMQRRGLEPPAS